MENIKNESSRDYEKILDKIKKEENKEKLVAILELTAHKLQINTISEIARINGITPNGVKSSKRYRKLFIGKQLMAIPNLKDNNKLPF